MHMTNSTAVVELLQQIDPYSTCNSPSWGHDVVPLIQGGWAIKFTDQHITIYDRDDHVIGSASITEVPTDLLPAMSYLADLASVGELEYIEDLTGVGMLCVMLDGACALRTNAIEQARDLKAAA